MSDYSSRRIDMYIGDALISADEHAQTSESPNMATATPSARRGPQTPQKQHAGSLELDAQPLSPASVLPESTARKVSALVWRAHIPDTYAASGPESATWKDPDPRRRSSRGSEI